MSQNRQVLPLIGFTLIIMIFQLIAFTNVSKKEAGALDVSDNVKPAETTTARMELMTTVAYSPYKRPLSGRHKVWYASAKGSECRRVQRYRGKIPLPLTALLSTQGSGNTWLRWLIESLTGICTGSLYKELSMRQAAFQCEMVPVTSGVSFIAYKVHYYHQLLANSSKVVLLIRNPFHALVSDFNRMNTRGNHTALAEADVFRTDDWHHFVVERSKEWLDLILASLAGSPSLLIVFYENLKNNMANELFRLGDFLGVRINDFRVNCVIENSAGVAKRPSRLIPNLFSTVDVKFVNSMIDKAHKAFKKHGIVNVPKLYESHSN